MILSQKNIKEIAVAVIRDFQKSFFGSEADDPARFALPTPIDQFASDYLNLKVSFQKLSLDGSIRNWGYEEDKTAQEYAAEKNLTMVNIGGGIINRDELGIAEISMDFISVEDDVMNIFMRCGVTETTKTREVNVVATGRLSDSEDVMRLESTFELQDMSTTTVLHYVCSEEVSGNDFYQIEKAEVI